jgi:Protein of unknown function (DUF4058)
MPMNDWTRVDDGTYHDFHTGWIAELRKVLNRGTLPKGYYALAEQQAGDYGPDVLTLRRPRAAEPGRDGEEAGGIAVATDPPRVEFTATSDLKAYTGRRRTLVIRHKSGNQVVAMIEIVSPGNKKTRQQLGRFVRKAVKVVSAGVHLLVVDPFPPGKWDRQGIHGAIWAELSGEDYQQPGGRPLTLASYAAGPTNTAYVQTFAVGQPLVEMPLFLTDERYVKVDLETAYQGAWDGTPDEVREQLSGPTA